MIIKLSTWLLKFTSISNSEVLYILSLETEKQGRIYQVGYPRAAIFKSVFISIIITKFTQRMKDCPDDYGAQAIVE